MRRSSDRHGFGLRLLLILIAIQVIHPAAVLATDDIVAIIVRFTAGEVTFPEDPYDSVAPLEAISFRTQELQSALRASGISSLELVCPAWRHLAAPQYDIAGDTVPIEQMVDFTDVYRLGWDGSVSPELIKFRLGPLRSIIYIDFIAPADPDYSPPDDPLFADQWALANTGQTYAEPESIICDSKYDINALEAWDIQDSSSVRVGLIDYGIDLDHEDLADALDPSLSFGPNGGQEDCPTWSHGSATAGIVGAVGGDSLGISGVATPRGGRILVPMRAASPDHPCAIDASYAADALAWACSANVFPQIPIVNNSWGYLGNELTDNQYKSVRDAYRNAYLKGLFLTASAGNRVAEVKFPAAFLDYTTAVTSVLCNGNRPGGYSSGTHIDVTAPGGAVTAPTTVDHIVSTWGDSSNDQYWGLGGKSYFGGTSASAAFVAGVGALLWSVPTLDNTLTNDDLDGVLKVTATNLGSASDFGWGLVRADSALMLIVSPNHTIHGTTSPIRISYIDSIAPLEVMNIPCITLGASSRAKGPEQVDTLSAHVYEMVGYASFTSDPLGVWPRGRQTNGWRRLDELPKITGRAFDGRAVYNWAEVIPNTVTAEGCSLRAYTYLFFDNGDSVGWYPVNGTTGNVVCQSPVTASLAYTYVTAGDDAKNAVSPRLLVRMNGPNPTASIHRLSWRMQRRELVRAVVYDVGGRQIHILANAPMGPGAVELTWDGMNLFGERVSAGIYFIKVISGSATYTRKLVVLPEGGG